MDKLVIEVAANEYEPREDNPHVPFTPDELGADAAACRAAGAAIYHFHPRTADGAPDLDYDTLRAGVSLVRAASDVLVHTSLSANRQGSDPGVRLDPMRRLSADELTPDFAPLDMGSSNMDLLTRDGRDFATTDAVYVNSTGTLRYLAVGMRELGIIPNLTVWNAGQLRLIEILHGMGHLDAPAWMHLALSEGRVFSNHPGTRAGLDAYLMLLPTGLPLHWAARLVGASVLDLLPHVLEHGGHVVVGLGDYHHAGSGRPTNAELVEQVAAMARAAGREIATPQEARTMLGVRGRTSTPTA
ncbi:MULTISPECIES: 3-keto-5-aminohexanoate cleavage protein [Pseudonocardia]|uniref:3-keto-5-aminohexanoate cleavage enzyme n=2 Tax=Pseudonocardia TaxID=1847 RepID=A0A1Y2MJR7_PSEAH|nr:MULTISPECIES: 3-keto-5-aminohexanoate cleavage protein [Pseudonocardia]OSY35249.1 3-keto-5-aminohexanoate cleavage enzyme [Pseudonocardia autotrophica]TDN73150.1 uncharacterized protein (DUF849 family) [Pseudonocardia autotrophica]BBG03872.1 3-keto-5-aminohexanoate cleavage protein [Pseudonocardia autotrophica]GEC29535.1 3-keto-5-aminohexanoate cleavage protein [Pseudonocardia saturnea]